MIDPVTSWFEMVEIDNKTPMNIVNIVELTWLNRYPRPKFITFDGGSEFKADFNNVKCKITAVLTKHYKVDMLEGPSKGKNHKYLHDQVTLITPAATGAGGEPPSPPSAPR